jgi:M6 family metalloprotease-like protein
VRGELARRITEKSLPDRDPSRPSALQWQHSSASTKNDAAASVARTKIVQPIRHAGVVVGVRLATALALTLAAVVLAAPRSHAATPTTACSPPALGFGAGEGANVAELPPTVGKLRIAMLFADFRDSPGPESPDAIYKAYSQRIVHWYGTVSYGRLVIEIVPLRKWLRLPQTLAEYESEHFEGAIEAAVAVADPLFDFADVDGLYLIAAIPALASTIIDDIPLQVDGAHIHSWAWLATGSLQRLPFVAIHETGHLLGLPDLYNERVPSSQHNWDVMTAAPGGGGMFAWHRWKLGWLDPDQVVCLTRRGTITATLAPIERAGGKKAIISRVGNQVVVVEVRRALEEDAAICTSGVLVYRVDFSAGSPANAGSRRMPIQVRAARRDDSRRWKRCGREWRAPFALGRGQVSRTVAWKHGITLLRRLPDGSYRVRVTRK